MTVLIPYLLKVMLCSALLLAYYYVALRNKLFHQWNRFYLLSTIVVSLIIPCLTFTFFHAPSDKESQTIKLLYAVSTGDEYVVDLTSSISFKTLLLQNAPVLLYGCISVVMLTMLLLSIVRIYALIQKHKAKRIDDIHFIAADVKGTPFSFFNYLFWNPSIALDSTTGQQIFQHEAAHIREKHTIDKLFVQFILVLFWYNPVFWLIRHELRMLHEFIADKKAVEHQDATALAAMILQAAYPQQYNNIINSFFHQSIKRRLVMLTKIQNPRMNYISRILFIPVMAFVVLAFTVRTKEKGSLYTGDKKITVVIDAGHGGTDAGAQAAAVLEKDMVLALAQQVKASNTNPNITIVLTRSNDEFVGLKDRVTRSVTNKADLFISLHINATTAAATDAKSYSGIEVVVPKDTVHYQSQSKVLGSALVQELSTIYTTLPYLLQRQMNSWVLNQNACPSVIIECGYITNPKDRAFFQQSANQKLVAQKILRGVEAYLQAKETSVLPVKTMAENTPSNDPSLAMTPLNDKDRINAGVDTVKPLYTKVDQEASFVGGTTGWRKFLEHNLKAVIPVEKGAPAGSYTVMLQFIVDKDGSVSDIQPLTKYGYGMEEEVVRMMQLSPKWMPAQVKGQVVASYRKQPVTFVIVDEPAQETITLKSGGKYTTDQLQAIPFAKLLQPNSDYTLVSAKFTMDLPSGDIVEMNLNNDKKPEKIEQLITNAKSGNIITIDARKAINKEGKEIKLPALVYYIQ